MFDKLEKDFSKSVEKHVKDNECGYIEAVVEICNELDIDPSLGSKISQHPHKRKD